MTPNRSHPEPSLSPAPNGQIPAGCAVFPVSFAQQRVWFLDQFNPHCPLYNIPLVVRLQGPLNVDALRRSLAAIVQRHESLRTTFHTVDAQPVQVIAPAATVELPVMDLSQLPESQREAEVARLATEEAARWFDLGKDLMLRARLVRVQAANHVLLLTIHHIASDGWSVGVLCRELSLLYAAFCAGRPSPLPELAIQYADYAVWQRNWLQGEVLEKQLEYWRKQLGGAPAILELPTDRPRPAVQSYRGDVETQVIPKALELALRELSQREGTSLFMTLLAAFQVLLYRYSGQEDITVGSPMAARHQPECEDVIGYFVNALMLRSDLSGNPTFRVFLARVRQVALEAYSYQDVPFEKLLEDLQPARNLSYSPLCQVLFAFQNMPLETPTLPGLNVSITAVSSGTAKFDLTLSVSERADALRATVEYSTDLFDRDTIVRFLDHYRTLLESIVTDPQQRIASLSLLTGAERQQLLGNFNDTHREFPREALVDELVEEQARRTPERIAAICGHRRLTYGDLNQQADALAVRLRTLGVGPDTLVAVHVERSLEMVVALLSILKAGGAYVPLDPTYPPERNAFVIEDTQPLVVLTQRSHLAELPANKAQVVLLDEPAASTDTPCPRRNRQPTDLAYVLYTSGSSGQPKGVQISHRALANFLTSMQREPGLTANDVVLALTTLSFDIAGLEIWLPLITGARVVIASRELAADGVRLARLIDDCGVTVMQATPVNYRVLLQAGWRGHPRLKILCGGDAWSVELANELIPRCGSLWNMYGPTETTIWSSVRPVKAGQPVRIGPPIANTTIHLLDDERQPVPLGVTGELCIGGDGVARGYLNRPELTAERFVPDPFSHQPGARLYRTGDRARRWPDGSLEFLGRLDHQVKIRGYRIELGEIESVLRQHPAVQEAVVTAPVDQPGERRLVAYLVPAGKISPSVDELRRHLLQKLPEYMVPSAFVALPELPLTPNGKVNRRALPAPDQTRPELTGNFLAPRDPLEQQLTQLWEKIFGIEPIGVRDNFFELGGHSLLAVRLFAQVQKLTGKNLPLVTLFQAPTIEQLAAILRQQGWQSPWASLVPIKPGGSKPPFYCVHGVGGNILEYLDLAKYLDADQPFYGLQAIGLDGRRPIQHETVEQMAAHYIEEIREFQPRGPYYLGGSSFGGRVAYEMAQQLRAAGEEVALLALFDTNGPGYPQLLPTRPAWQRKLDWWSDRARLHWGNLRASSGREKLAYARDKADRWRKQARWQRQQWWDRVHERVQRRFWPAAIRQARLMGYRAATTYRPQPYAGQVTLFRATEQPRGIEPDPTLGWGPLVKGGLVIYDTPGHHGAIVREPRARRLAEQLQHALHKAYTKVKSAGSPPVKNGPDSSPVHDNCLEEEMLAGREK